jgi:hypothetical protein
MAHRVQTRQELFFPQPLRQELAIAPAQPHNFANGIAAQRQIAMPQGPINARELVVNNAMLAQMFENIYRMGQDSRGSDEETHRLALENRELRQQFIQRIDALETKWIGVVEHVSAKVDAIHLRLSKLHKELMSEYEEARRIKDIELQSWTTPEGYWATMGKHFGWDFSIIGAAYATTDLYDISLRVFFHGQLWDTTARCLRDYLKAHVRAEVQKMKEEMVSDESIQGSVGGSQQIAVISGNEAIAIDVGAVFETFRQKYQKETQTRDERNAVMRNNNVKLMNKIKELESIDKSFLAVVQKRLPLYLNLMTHFENMIYQCKSQTQCYNERLAKIPASMQSTSREGGSHKKGIEISGRISSHLNEILPLVEALQKEITL